MTRFVAGFGALMFVVFAILQANDPDAMQWILAYGYAAVVCSVAVLGHNVSLPAMIGIIGFLLASALIFPFGDTRRWLDVETAREGGGLVLAAVWLALVVGSDHWRRHRGRRPAEGQRDATT